MAGAKQTYEIELTSDQMSFLRSAKDKYDIPDESKVVRAILDYLLTTPGVHDVVFSQSRCLRCE